MPRTILVTEGDTPLGAELARLLSGRGYAVAALSDRRGGGTDEAAAPANPLVLPWNRRSPVSARSVVLSALNAFGRLDEAIILEPACAAAGSLAGVSSADIERSLDDAKGPLFILREVVAGFGGRPGTLSFVSGGSASGPVESATREAFRGLAAVLLSSPGPGIVANGFQAGGAGAEEYAAFIDRTLEERARKISGRWFAFPPRGGFLQGVFRTSSTP